MMRDPEFYEHINFHHLDPSSGIFRWEWPRFLTKIPQTSPRYGVMPEDVATRICDVLPLLEKIMLYIICKGIRQSIMLFPLIQKDYPQVPKKDFVVAYNNLFEIHRIVACIPSRTSNNDIILSLDKKTIDALLRQLKPIVDRTRGPYETLYMDRL